jgi:hypothetical protein
MTFFHARPLLGQGQNIMTYLLTQAQPQASFQTVFPRCVVSLVVCASRHLLPLAPLPHACVPLPHARAPLSLCCSSDFLFPCLRCGCGLMFFYFPLLRSLLLFVELMTARCVLSEVPLCTAAGVSTG